MPTVTVHGRQLNEAALIQIQGLVDGNPSWSRRRISIELVRIWEWRNAAGQLKDMSCRQMLARLALKGLVRLPACKQKPSRRKSRVMPTLARIDRTEIFGALAGVQPVSLEVIRYGTDSARLFDALLSQFHYLGYSYPVGANVRYMVRDRCGRLLACAVWASAALKVKSRDQWLGWSEEKRMEGLCRLANNTRFCVLPWVKVPHLASHLLGLMARQLRIDWPKATGHHLALLETFVDESRFRGTCYTAANWLDLGRTVGRTRNDTVHSISAPIKQVRVLPLMPLSRLRRELTE
jgi:Domain of unknown function (DUF4338)